MTLLYLAITFSLLYFFSKEYSVTSEYSIWYSIQYCIFHLFFTELHHIEFRKHACFLGFTVNFDHILYRTCNHSQVNEYNTLRSMMIF